MLDIVFADTDARRENIPIGCTLGLGAVPNFVYNWIS